MSCKIYNAELYNAEYTLEKSLKYLSIIGKKKKFSVTFSWWRFKRHRVFAKWWYALNTSMLIAYSCSQLAYGLTVDQSLWHFNYSYVTIFWSAFSYFRYVYLYFRYSYLNYDILLYYTHTMYMSWFILFYHVVFIVSKRYVSLLTI